MECEAVHSPTKKRIKSLIDNQILYNDLAIVSCVYVPLLQPGVLSLR